MRCLLLVAIGATGAYAAPMSVTGNVIDAHGRWTDDGSSIVTEATIQTADGLVVVTQLGGSADGYGMITFPGPAILAPGMQVALGAHADADLAGRMHVMVDTVGVTGNVPYFVRT